MAKKDTVLEGLHSDAARAALTAILEGALDNEHDLDILERNAKARRTWLLKNQFRVGQRVRLVNTKNPELEGKQGTIVKHNPRRLSVFLDSDWAEWMGPLDRMTIAEKRDFASLGVPPSMLEKV